MRCGKNLLTAFFALMFTGIGHAQQLSLGNTPYTINKSAVLELNATNQGLLLPRIADTTLINALNPPDGMVIYFTPSKQFLLRAYGYWNPLAASSSFGNYWSTTGNANGSIKKIGTADNYALPFVTNNVERMRLTTAGYLGIGTTTPSALLHVSGTNPLVLNGVQTGTTTATDSLLTINNGTVQKLPVTTFQTLINGTGFVKASGTTLSYDNNAYTIANSPITASTKTKITYDAKGLVIGGTNLTAGDIPDLSATYQLLNGSLTSISSLAGTTGYLKKTAANTYVLDNSSFLTSESDPVVKAINGLVKSNGATISAATAGTDYVVPNTAITGATKTKITYDSKGLVTAGTDATTTDIAEGTNLYYTDARVRATPLTGLSTATATGVTATDNLLAGVGKLQGQINTINGAGYLTGNQNITWSASGDATGSASGTTTLSPSLTITGLRGVALPSLSAGLLKYNGSAWTFDNSGYLTSETSTLANVTGRGNTTATGIGLTQNGNTASSFALYLKRNTDVSPAGNLIQAQNAAATTDLFKVDAGGNTTAGSFIKSGGTSSQFLKADGSVDNTTYLAGNQSITLSGDVSGSGTTAITTAIGINKVTLNHMAQVANGTFLGRTSAGTGNVEALTTTQAKTLLGITGSNSGDVTLSGQNYLSLSGQTITANAIDLSGTHATGTLAAARFGALTGDVTNTAGSYTTTISNGAVTYGKMQNISANNRLLGRATAGAGSPEEITLGSGLTLTGTTLSATGTSQWNIAGNSGTNYLSNFLGTTDNASFRFRTANIQRMIIDSMGYVGIGVSNPANPLVVKDTMEIRRTGTLSTLLFSNTAGAGDFRIAGDGGDIFWQGGGGRALQMGSYWGMVLGGDRQSVTFPSFTAGTGGTGVLVPAQRSGSIPLAVQGATGQSANLTEWRNSSNTVLNAITSAGNLGIGTSSPSAKLHVVGTNPLTLNGVQLGGTTAADSVLTINNGTVQKLPVATFATSLNAWSTLGNSGINWQTHFLGSVNNASLRFRTNNTERMVLDSLGNLAIGSNSLNATNPEKLLVDAGVTNSFNLMTGKGSIDNYLQINVQNKSATGSASSDLVATADNGDENGKYIDMGINSSAYSNNAYPVIGGINTAYLYGTGNDFVIGNATANQSLRLFTGGYALANERMRIDGSGKIGIGNTAPTEVLDVTGNLKFSGAFMPAGAAGSAGYLLQSNGTGTAPTWINGLSLMSAAGWMLDGNAVSGIKKFGTTSNYALPFITNNTEWMRLGTNGYLGLGTTAPAGRFHAVSDNSETGNDYLFDDYSNANTPGLFLRRSRGTVASPLNLQAGDIINAINFVPRINGSLGYAPGSSIEAYYQGTGTDNQSDLRLSTSGAEQLRINEDGNVGIGTSTFDNTNPEKFLVDAGNTSSYNLLKARGSINNYLQMNLQNTSTGTSASTDIVATADNGTETANYVDMGINGSGYTAGYFGTANDGYLYSLGQDFLVGNATAGKRLMFLTGGGDKVANTRMTIDNTGSVGIATTTPNASTKLDVNGAVKIGTSGTAVKNLVTATATFASNQNITAASFVNITGSITPGTTDVTYTLPVANTLSSAQAAVSVSPGSDLPTGVSIAYARATSTTVIKVRFINNSTSTQTIASGTKLYFSITDF